MASDLRVDESAARPGRNKHGDAAADLLAVHDGEQDTDALGEDGRGSNLFAR